MNPQTLVTYCRALESGNAAIEFIFQGKRSLVEVVLKKDTWAGVEPWFQVAVAFCEEHLRMTLERVSLKTLEMRWEGIPCSDFAFHWYEVSLDGGNKTADGFSCRVFFPTNAERLEAFIDALKNL